MHVFLRYLLMSLNQFLNATILSILSICMLGCSRQTDTGSPATEEISAPGMDNEIAIVVGGDWDDKWGESGATQQSLSIGASHDIILMSGDLSYAGIDDDVEYNIQNAKDWSAKVNAIVGETPVLFVAGDHDSRSQDGDIMTYANALKYPDGTNGVMPPTGKLAGLDYEGKYPYLWFNDIVDGDVKVRIVGTSSAFQESPGEPASVQKYLVNTYAAGSENYNWIEAVYADARDKGYWILHMNHLPWIDMGKNQSFADSQDLIDLASTYGVNILTTASSHNIWRTKPLKIDADRCPTIALTTDAQGANPECVGNRGNTHYKESDGMIQAHVGVAGKTHAFDLEKYPDACDPKVDGEVVHYVADGTCVTSAITGVVSLRFTAKTLSGEFIKTDGSIFAPYTFVVDRN